MSRDPFRLTDQLDAAALAVMAERLEARGRHPYFTAALDQYLARMAIDRCQDVLDLGCGTGIVARLIAARPSFAGSVVGIDRSPDLVRAAQRFAGQEGLGGRVRCLVGDAHKLAQPDASFDAVVAHTLFSHLDDPAATLVEMARVLRPGGVLAVFDGDYASLTFELAEPERSRRMDDAIVASLVTNPRILRQLPRLLRQAGFVIEAVLPSIITETGRAAFWQGGIEAYARLAPSAGQITAEEAAAWLQELRAISERNEFFGACVYYAYIGRKPPA